MQLMLKLLKTASRKSNLFELFSAFLSWDVRGVLVESVAFLVADWTVWLWGAVHSKMASRSTVKAGSAAIWSVAFSEIIEHWTNREFYWDFQPPGSLWSAWRRIFLIFTIIGNWINSHFQTLQSGYKKFSGPAIN